MRIYIVKEVMNVNDILELYDVCGINMPIESRYEIEKSNFTKDEVIKIVYRMSEKLNRPLMYDDFRNPKLGEVGITIIKKYWKNMNEMKKELKLEIVQEDMMSKHIDEVKMQEEIRNMCETVYKNENRKLISYKDINKNNGCSVKSGAYVKYMKNPILRDFIKSLGFELLREGNGLNHIFEDGEKIRSSYEYDFSIKLKQLGMSYNKDYFRDVRYNTFVPNYNGLLDCDYIITKNDKLLYIEIVGMLRDYKNNYVNDEKIVSSKSKENYRLKLLEKERMFKDNNLNYLILFPSDLKDFDINNYI